MDDLEALTYETFERDTMKYIQYQRAVCKASLNKVLGEKAPIVTEEFEEKYEGIWRQNMEEHLNSFCDTFLYNEWKHK